MSWKRSYAAGRPRPSAIGCGTARPAAAAALRPGCGGRTAPFPPADGGFTLVEMVVAIGLIATIATSATTLHITSMAVAREQADRQVAAQMVSRALDTARSRGGAALLASPPPTLTVQVNGISFRQRWSVTRCWRAPAGGDCTTADAGPGIAELTRVVVTVEWTDAGVERAEHTAALVSAAVVDPAFPA